jgi:hypothetical protein
MTLHALWEASMGKNSTAPAPDAPRADYAAAYDRLGFRLCAIPPGSKGPQDARWTERPHPPEHWARQPEIGMGAILGLSGLVSLDLDRLDDSRALFAELGLDLGELTADAAMVQGHPERGRALFRAPAGVQLGTHKLVWPHPSGETHPNGRRKTLTVFELRAGAVQDVLPPTIHPGTGAPYKWLRSPWELGELPELPAPLLELWQNWSAWEPELVRLCPWATREPPPAKKSADAGPGIIAAFNQAHDVGALLDAHGYVRKTPKRWLAPDSSTGLPGVVLLDSGKVYSHHGDVLATGHALDAFDLYRILEHGGDAKAAARAAARLLGLERDRDTDRDKTGDTGTSAPQDDAKPRGNGLGLVLVRELLQPPPAVEWTIRHWLPPEQHILLFGDPASGKSLITIDWAASIACGLFWCGKRTRQGPVVYIAGEGHFGIRRRMKAWAMANQTEGELSRAALAVTSKGARLADAAGFEAALADVDAFAEAHGTPLAIIVDTLHRNMGPGDENSAMDMGRYIDAADRLRERYAATVVTVHHSGHGDKGRSRGSSALLGGVDGEFRLERDASGLRTLSCPSKFKDAPPPAPLHFRLEQVRLPWLDADGEPETSVVLTEAKLDAQPRPTKRAPAGVRLAFETLLAALQEAGAPPPDGWTPPAGQAPGRVVGLDDWRRHFYGRHTGDGQEAKKKAFQRGRDDLAKAGAVACWQDFYFLGELAGGACPWGDLPGIAAAWSAPDAA